MNFSAMFKKSLVFILAMVIVIAGATPIFADNTSPKPAPPKAGITRVYGSNKYTTATAVADELKDLWKVSKFDAVVVATGDSYLDALSGSYLANKYNAPILLVSNKNYKTTLRYVRDNLKRGGDIFVIGGPLVVSNSIVSQLGKYGKVKRLSGKNAIATNLAVLKHDNPKNSALIVCSSYDYSDAVSAASTGQPILLVKKSLSGAQKTFLKAQAKTNPNIYIAGGPVAVSKDIEKELKACGFTTVRRIAGSNKYTTAIALGKSFYPKAKEEVLATGDDFSDALVGSVLARAKRAPLLLTTKSKKFQTTFNHNVTNKINSITIIGGPLAVENDATGINGSGKFLKGFLTVGGTKYYANKNSQILRDTIFSHGGEKYYAKKNGAIATGTIVRKDGKVYAASSSGILKKAKNIIYLTFDDGPGPYTEKLLGILNKYDAKATFFVNPYRDSYRYLIGKAYRSGHAIGNHSYSHDWSIYSSSSSFWRDMDKANDAIKKQTGERTKLLRFPGGSSNTISRSYSRGIMSTLTKQCKSHDYVYFDWDVDSYDAGGATSANAVYKNIVNGVSGKQTSIVLCHDIKSYTVNAIEDVIRWGQRNGYVFLPLTEDSPVIHHAVAN